MACIGVMEMWLCLPDLWNVLAVECSWMSSRDWKPRNRDLLIFWEPSTGFFSKMSLEKYPHGKPSDEEGQEHHGLVSWDLFLLFLLKFLPTQRPCGQRVTHLPHPFSGGIPEDSQIIPSIPLFCHSPPSPSTSEVAGWNWFSAPGIFQH